MAMNVEGTVEGDEQADQSNSGTRTPAITAVICTHNRYDVLPDAIESLSLQSLARDEIEVLIVDNSSDIQTQRDYWGTHEPPPNGRLLVETTPGLSRARNAALRSARAPVVAYIDDDAIALSDWCASIVETFRDRPDAGIVGGPVEPIWPDSAPTWLHKWQRGFLTIVDLGDELRPLQDGEWLAGTNIAFQAAALKRAGGFNEGLGRTGAALLSNEELVVSRKIRDSGLQAYYDPRARVMHRVHADRVTQRWLRQRVCWQAVSDLLADGEKPPRKECWAEMATYLSGLPVEMRGLRGLFYDVPDAENFYLQCRALEALMHLALHEAEDPERE